MPSGGFSAHPPRCPAEAEVARSNRAGRTVQIGHLDPTAASGKTLSVPRWVRVLLIVLVVAVAIYLVGFVLFNTGGSMPGSGTGDVLTQTTP